MGLPSGEITPKRFLSYKLLRSTTVFKLQDGVRGLTVCVVAVGGIGVLKSPSKHTATRSLVTRRHGRHQSQLPRGHTHGVANSPQASL